jgi:hypothetical protein
MAALEYLAREFRFSASADGTTWTEVGGIASWGWTEEGTDVDVTDFDDEGWDHTMVARRKAALTLSGNWLMDEADGTRDAGQSLVEQYAREVGQAGLFHFKVETRAESAPDTPLGSITFRCSAKLGQTGGGNDDKMPFAVDLLIKGKPTFAGCFA